MDIRIERVPSKDVTINYITAKFSRIPNAKTNLFSVVGLITSTTNEGFDIELTLTISERTMIPIIASGGAGKLDHFYEVFTKGKADAALAASIFHYDKFPVNTVKKYLLEKGVIVRPW